MQPPELHALAAACLPGRGEIELTRLSRGLSDDTFQARRSGHQFTLRLARTIDAEAMAGRTFESRLIERAAAAGLAPPLIHSEPLRGILVLEWLPGRPWEAESVTGLPHIRAAAALMRRVHALPAPQPLRLGSPAGWVERYRRDLGDAAAVPAELNRAADRLLERLAALPPVPAVVCHSDLHRLNVLEQAGHGPAQSVLLDWEYAHQSEPGWDLAGWSANNDFTPSQSRALLAAYAGGAADGLPWQRFVLLRWLFDYVCVLWTQVYQRVMPAQALDERAACLETRLTAAVCGKLAHCDEPYFLES